MIKKNGEFSNLSNLVQLVIPEMIKGKDQTFGFSGSDYEPWHDGPRLTNQLARIKQCIKDGQWRTLAEIASATGAPESSVSAQLRNLRKSKFGAFKIEKRSRGDRSIGLWEYRMAKE